jgi:hypothetical protein
MANGAIDEAVKTLVSRGTVDGAAVQGGFGHQAFQPPEAMWALIVCPGWRTMIPAGQVSRTGIDKYRFKVQRSS